MKNRLMKWMATPLLLLLVAFAAKAQEEASGYYPFVSTNLNDPAKIKEGTVVEKSYRYFKVAGDPNFKTAASTFVWYVENGTFGTYDNMTDQWTELSTGPTFELEGKFIDGVGNSSEIWVKWDEDSGGKTGYVAVYERSSTNCILDNAITGFKLNIVAPPEAWFAEATQAECADQEYSVELRFNHIYTHSYPYVLSYKYPNEDGVLKDGGPLVITDGMLTANGDGTFTYMLDLNMIHDIDVTKDEVYTLELTKLRDKNGSDGELAPLGSSQNQYKELNLTINHLPQTGGMTME
jgi:hypothetical protein